METLSSIIEMKSNEKFNLNFYFNLKKGGLMEKIVNYMAFKIKKSKYNKFLDVYNTLTLNQKVLYNTILEVIRFNDAELDISPITGDISICNEDIYCKVTKNHVEIAQGWNTENIIYYLEYMPDKSLDRIKIKFNEKKTTQIKLKEDKILSGLRKKLNTVYDKTYKLNRHI